MFFQDHFLGHDPVLYLLPLNEKKNEEPLIPKRKGSATGATGGGTSHPTKVLGGI